MLTTPLGRMASSEGYCDPDTSPVLSLLRSQPMTRICAPMVRYSKQSFRQLVRLYGVDVAYTPMILADSFTKSAKARNADFSTSSTDRPLIVQVASNCSEEFALAAEMVTPLSDGIDINCGCPQRWAVQEHYGCWMLSQPDLVADMISTARRRLPSRFTVSIKIRLKEDLRQTVEFVRRMEAAGVSFLTVHGRTQQQRVEPPNLEAVKLLRESVNIPVVHNGGINTLQEAEDTWSFTGVAGIMVAQGLLNNPALFDGHPHTPESCVSKFLDVATKYGTQFSHFQHHVSYMVKDLLPRADRHQINLLGSTAAIIDFLGDRGII
ncbi:tRNA-dihydrouridine(20a/20b) synthase [NAD(P)+]-like [Varroa jacobsoni]|uniref:tRNA-dihydrouridine synthase n=1 Tax=Varroa destructor TaxID=109461 RepID=A0A7M7KZE9_VARDE|nr:tRNA-dihydrouridine(20a/20b) synthase [NAD(P)+]-like isoform X1 [Varroa destructor]XP_022691261.1 tRNA-dihydrouridine(20a/20b) synthase [NAD(P)+]-like [Varroa jacobsoni]XP_022691262.1 tRNA-dihydrouridine(20a/20b) synthase [NAD(P)+]-like [Varroa jacobsoni]